MYAYSVLVVSRVPGSDMVVAAGVSTRRRMARRTFAACRASLDLAPRSFQIVCALWRS
jgi:hypothetical protein